MAIYHYKAMDNAGRQIVGAMEAVDAAALEKQLTGNGLFLMEAAPAQRRAATPAAEAAPVAPGAGPAFKPPKKQEIRKISLLEVATFTTQLSLMVKSALPAMQAIDSLILQQKNLVFRFVLNSIAERIKRGESMSRAFARYPEIFDNVYVSLLAAGEASGNVSELLERIGDYLHFRLGLRDKVRSAMIYPIIVLVVSVVVILFLMFFVLPTFVDIFNQFNAALPLPTRILLGTSGFCRSYWYLFAAGAAGLFFGARYWYGIPSNRDWLDEFSLRVPVVGPMIEAIVLARVLRTLSDLVRGGVPILGALQLTREAANHSYYRKLLDQVMERVSQGKGLASALYTSEHFPRSFANMIAIAERTGNLPEILTMAAAENQKNLDVSIDNTFAALEPIFVGCLSLAVATIVICVLEPIMTLGNAVG